MGDSAAVQQVERSRRADDTYRVEARRDDRERAERRREQQRSDEHTTERPREPGRGEHVDRYA